MSLTSRGITLRELKDDAVPQISVGSRALSSQACEAVLWGSPRRSTSGRSGDRAQALLETKQLCEPHGVLCASPRPSSKRRLLKRTGLQKVTGDRMTLAADLMVLGPHGRTLSCAPPGTSRAERPVSRLAEPLGG